MRIALRTSGGRGEYELAGSHGSVSVADTIDCRILVQMLPGREINTNNWVRRLQGKPRIRLANQGVDKHIYLTISDILLMPRPKRELSKTSTGKLQLTEYNYSISSIQFDIVRKQDDYVLIQPTDLILENVDGDLARIDVFERLRIILDMWWKASSQSDPLSALILSHRDAFYAGDIPSIRATVEEIRGVFGIDDPLREILRRYSLLDEYTYWMGVHRNDVELSMIEDDSKEPSESVLERVKKWRLQASRGSRGAIFSREVKKAYNNQCLFTGYYLPQSSFCSTAGVDSAHILPWAEYDINSISNGLCLNKLCHWAFDSGILLLTFSDSRYELSISGPAKKAEKDGLISLEAFSPFVGTIPESRFPSDVRLWPSQKYLEEYNRALNL